MVRFRVFAMYVRTELVHTYIVKRPSFLLYRILAVPKVGTATSIARIGTESVKSIGVFNLELLTKYTKAISYGIIEKTRKGGQNAAQNPHSDHRRSHAARPLFEEVGESA